MKTQIWIAISVYVLVAIVKKRLGLDVTLYLLAMATLENNNHNAPILDAVDHPVHPHPDPVHVLLLEVRVEEVSSRPPASKAAPAIQMSLVGIGGVVAMSPPQMRSPAWRARPKGARPKEVDRRRDEA